MPVNIMVYDHRISEVGPITVPAPRQGYEVLFCDRMTPLDRLIGDIFDIAKARGPIDILRLMCRPTVSGVYARDLISEKYDMNWMGLLLASGVYPEATTYGTFAPLWGRVRTIIVYAGLEISYGAEYPADQKLPPDGGFGRLLMQLLANQTRAQVIAPDTQQTWATSGKFWELFINRPFVVDFGEWEGQLWRYTPDQKRPVRHDV